MVAATERLIEEHNPRWNLGGGRGVHPEWLPGLGEAGLRNIEAFSYDVDVPYTPEAWIGRIRASAGIAALSLKAIQAFGRHLAQVLAERFSAGILLAPHRVFAIVAAGPS
jgi:hypothetical protein